MWNDYDIMHVALICIHTKYAPLKHCTAKLHKCLYFPFKTSVIEITGLWVTVKLNLTVDL